MLDWIGDHEALGWSLVALSVLTFGATLLLIPLLIIRIPADYFEHRRPPPDSWPGRHPAVRLAALAAKNLLGLVFLVAGFAMLVLPGQGLLTILIGISLLNFPGKRALELRIVRQRNVLAAINWLRARYHRPPLRVPPRRARRVADGTASPTGPDGAGADA